MAVLRLEYLEVRSDNPLELYGFSGENVLEGLTITFPRIGNVPALTCMPNLKKLSITCNDVSDADTFISTKPEKALEQLFLNTFSLEEPHGFAPTKDISVDKISEHKVIQHTPNDACKTAEKILGYFRCIHHLILYSNINSIPPMSFQLKTLQIKETHTTSLEPLSWLSLDTLENLV